MQRLVTGFIFLTVLCAGTGPVAADSEMPEIPYKTEPRPGLLIGGQPDREALAQARDAGAETVINLRGTDEFDDWNQTEVVTGLGMLNIHIPVASADDLNQDSVELFDRALEHVGDEPAIVHCASGNRVGAMYALRAAWLQGEDTETALEIGREHGLEGLADTVEELLDSGSDSD